MFFPGLEGIEGFAMGSHVDVLIQLAVPGFRALGEVEAVKAFLDWLRRDRVFQFASHCRKRAARGYLWQSSTRPGVLR